MFAVLTFAKMAVQYEILNTVDRWRIAAESPLYCYGDFAPYREEFHQTYDNYQWNAEDGSYTAVQWPRNSSLVSVVLNGRRESFWLPIHINIGKEKCRNHCRNRQLLYTNTGELEGKELKDALRRGVVGIIERVQYCDGVLHKEYLGDVADYRPDEKLDILVAPWSLSTTPVVS